MSNTNSYILTELKEGVFTITIDRPKVNALTGEMAEAIQAAIKQAERDDRARCVLLTSSGNIFSAGQDIREAKPGMRGAYRKHLQKAYNPLILQIRHLEKPVLAALRGVVSGAALGIALACDLRIATDDLQIVVGFLGIGLTPDSAVSLLLPALIGLGRAQEAAFTNAPISAMQALAWGLVNRVVPCDELNEQTSLWATELVQGPIHSMGLAKRAFNKAVMEDLEQVLDYEAHLQDIACQGSEHQEGLRAFLEKRKPRFSG